MFKSWWKVDAQICESWRKEKEMLKIKYSQNLRFPEAKKIIETLRFRIT